MPSHYVHNRVSVRCISLPNDCRIKMLMHLVVVQARQCVPVVAMLPQSKWDHLGNILWV